MRTTPFTIFIDTAEQLPFVQGIHCDSDKNYELGTFAPLE